MADVNAKILINYDEYARLKSIEAKSHTSSSSTSTSSDIDQAGKGLLRSPVPTSVIAIQPSQEIFRKPESIQELPDVISKKRKVKKSTKKSTKKKNEHNQLGGGEAERLEASTSSSTDIAYEITSTPQSTSSVSTSFIPRNFLFLD